MSTTRAARWLIGVLTASATVAMTLFALPAVAGAVAQGGAPAGPGSPAATPRGAAPGSLIAAGTVVADSGFQLSKDGFSFENYGNEPGVQNLTPAEMEAIYGPAVCASQEGGVCQLTPPAANVMTEWNKAMDGGHCYGMAVTALLLFKGQLNPEAYGGQSASQMPFAGNGALQHRIAQSFVFQDFPSVTSGQIGGTPDHVLKALIARLQATGPESWTIGFYKSDRTGGHEVTPFKVVDDGNGQYSIEIYDNNYPGEVRTIHVDTLTNSWSYVASTNPNVPADRYTGNAHTKTLELSPTLPGTKVQPCPFCSDEQAGDYAPAAGAPAAATPAGTPAPSAGTGAPTRTITLEASPNNHGHLVLTDPQGRQTGFVGGRFVNHIPGVKVLFPILNTDFREAEEPTYEVPVGFPLQVTLDGGALRQRSVSTLDVTGPAYDTAISHIVLRPGQRDRFELASDSPQISYRPAGAGSPQVSLGVDTATADYRLSLQTRGMQAGQRVSFDLRLHNLVIDAHTQSVPTTYRVRLVREDASGTGPPVQRTLHLGAHATTRVPYTTW